MNRSTPPAASSGLAVAAGPMAAGAGARWRTALSVFKVRIGVLIMVTALGGMAIVPGSRLGLLQVLVLALAVLVAAASAGAFNQFVEADADRLMARTRGRAFASGALPCSAAWLAVIVGLIVLAVAVAAWVVNGLAALFVGLGAFTYGVVYTLWLKRRTAWNIVIGGLSGSFAVLAGAAAVDPQIPAQAWALALVLFLWTPPHFWSLAIAVEADYRAAGVPMLPVVVGVERAARIVHASTLLLVASSFLPLLFGAGWLVGVGALLGGAHFLRCTRVLARAPARKTAMTAFFASMVQLSVLLLAVVIDAALR
jgi:protoheme IX farnesyltransferase